jgi:hypothetical protein
VIHCEIEEMGRAGDARVVVANRLRALPGQVLIVEIQPTGDEPAQIVFKRQARPVSKPSEVVRCFG